MCYPSDAAGFRVNGRFTGASGPRPVPSPWEQSRIRSTGRGAGRCPLRWASSRRNPLQEGPAIVWRLPAGSSRRVKTPETLRICVCAYPHGLRRKSPEISTPPSHHFPATSVRDAMVFISSGGRLPSGLPPSPRGRGGPHLESGKRRGSSSLAPRRRGRASPSSPSFPPHGDVDSPPGGEYPGSLAFGREDLACGGPSQRRE